jgi:maleylpyruvate isomerase
MPGQTRFRQSRGEEWEQWAIRGVAVILYTYFRSSAAYRVRIALHLKALPFEAKIVHLIRNGGAQHDADYRRMNPLGRVPTLIDGARTLTQSMAIMEYLDEAYGGVPIMPAAPWERAAVRAMALTLVADTQPLQNLSATRYLSKTLSLPKAAVDAWSLHWMSNGLRALEALLADSASSGAYCSGDFPTIADICLVAQCMSARRLNVAIEDYPNVARIDAACRSLPEFRRAAPEAQPDFEAV